MAFVRRWWQFLKERHEPFSITLMVAIFFAAVAFVAYQPGVHAPPCWKRLAAGFAIVWLIFLHMRMFDEVKDYDVDREHNPERPLARGLAAREDDAVEQPMPLAEQLTHALEGDLPGRAR